MSKDDRTFRRVLRVASQPGGGGGLVRAVVEDDYHHFRVEFSHDRETVTSISTSALRGPFSLCGAAGQRLQGLVGAHLADRMSEVFLLSDARQQCTHQFDLAALAVATAARGLGSVRYDIAIPDTPLGPTEALLHRNDSEVLRWTLDGPTITGPAPFCDRPIGAGFTDWTAEYLTTGDAEAALVLRRGVFIAHGRRQPMMILPHAPARGGCWVQQPERNTLARPIPGHRQDFTDRPEALTNIDDAWLSFDVVSAEIRQSLQSDELANG